MKTMRNKLAGKSAYGPYPWGFRREYPSRTNRGRRARAPRSSTYELEAFEPRLLLSADGLIPGLISTVENGMLATGGTLLGFIANDTLFDTPIPGVLQTTHDVAGDSNDDGLPNGKVDDKDLHAPGLTDVLSLNVNRNGDANEDGTERIEPLFLPVNQSDLKDVYRYVSGQKELFPGVPYLPTLEQALSAMDLNSGSTADNLVDFQEIYKVLVVGAISDFLDDYSVFLHTAETLKTDFAGFLNGLAAPGVLGSVISLDLAGVSNSSDATHFSYGFTINLKVKDQFLIDLGLNADKNEIILPEKVFTATPAQADAPSGPRHVELGGSIGIPFTFNLDISPAANFRFGVPSPITVAVDDSVAGSGGETLNGLITNVGFLGTVVPGPDSASKFNLHMDWSIKVTDPSSPSSLGFTQALPTSSSTGVFTGATALPNDPGTPYVFPQDVVFELTIGTQLNSPKSTVTVDKDYTTLNTTADNLRFDVQTALNAAGLGSIVTAGLDGSNRLTLSLPSTNILPLGYASNQLFDQVVPIQLDASNAPSILGHTTPDVVRFLLSVGGGIPTLVTVTTTPGNDDADGVADSGDEGQLSLAGLIQDLNAALPAGVTASDNAGKIRISHASLSLEVTRTIKLDAKNEITSAELSDPSFPEFVVLTKDLSDDVLNIVMPLNVRQGLDFGPTGSPGIKVDFAPFDSVSLTPDPANVKRFTLPLMNLDGPAVAIDDLAGGSNFIQYLDFNSVGPGEAIGMIQQLETWLVKLKETDMLGTFHIPFAQAVLGNLLAFDDLLHDNLLLDDLDDDDDATNTGRLLARITAIDPDAFVAVFGTAQELGARLNALFSPSILTKPTTNHDGQSDTASDFAAYDKTTKQLTYQISLTSALPGQNVASDFTSDLDLSPIVDISTQSKVHLEATGRFEAILGMELGPGQITSGTLLSDLNGGLGAGIASGVAFTGAGDVRAIQGRLSADATFQIGINGGTPVEVRVYKKLGPAAFSAGAVNATTNEITLSGHGLSTGDAVIYDHGGGTTIGGLTSGTTYFVVRVDNNKIKLATTAANALNATPVAIDLTSAGAGANHTLHHPNHTDDNVTTANLLSDINTALATAGLGTQIEAAEIAGNIVLKAIDSSVTRFSVNSSPTNTAYTELGLPTTVAATVFLEVQPANVKVSSNTALKIFVNGSATSTDITLLSAGSGVAATGGNNTLTDLANDINEALVPTSLYGKVVAARSGNKLLLVGIDESIESIRAFGSSGPAGQIGFGSQFNGSSGSIVSAADNTIAITGHGFASGQAVVYRNGGGTSMAGLNDGQTYYVIRVDADTVKLALTKADALATAPVPVDITGTGTGSAHVLQTPIGGVLLVAPNDTNSTNQANIFGRVTDPASFSIKINNGAFKNLVINPADTVDSANPGNSNASLADLINDINGKIQADADLKNKVQAFQVDNFRIGFRAVSDSVLSFQVQAAAGDPAVTQIGLFAGIQTADAALRVGAIKRAPAFFGPGSDASFTIFTNLLQFDPAAAANLATNRITLTGHGLQSGDAVVYSNGGGTSIGGLTHGTTYYVIRIDADTIQLALTKNNALASTPVPADLLAGAAGSAHNLGRVATVATVETLTNQTIQDLTGDVRRALDAAFGGVSLNPLLVSNDGNRLLLKPKSASGVSAFSLVADAANPAYTDLKLYQAGGTPTLADTADLLIYTRNGDVHRVFLSDSPLATVGDVVAAIDAIAGVSATINATASGLTLTDTSGAGSTLFRVDSVNGSHAAQALGIFGADTDVNHPVADDQIDGTRIATFQLADRFFLRQVDASTPILGADITVGAATFNGSSGSVVTGNQIKLPGHGFASGDALVYDSNGADSPVTGLTSGQTYYVINVDQNTIKLASTKESALAGTALGISAAGTGTAHQLQSLLSLEGNFGFVGVKLNGSGAISADFGMALQDTSATALVRLSDLLEAMSKDQAPKDGDVDVFDLATIIKYPTVTPTSGTDFGTLTFLTTLQDGLPAGTINIDSGAKIHVTLNEFGNPFAAPKDVTFPSTDVSTTGDTITETGHGLATGMEVGYRNGAGTDIGGLVDGGRYFVIKIDNNTIKLATTEANALSYKDFTFASGDVNLTDNTIAETAHGLTTGTQVVYTDGGGASLGGLTAGTTYFAIVVDANTIKLAATKANALAGTAVDLTSAAANPSHRLQVPAAINLTSQGTGTDHRLQGFIPVLPHVQVDYTTDANLADLPNFTDIDFTSVISALEGISDFLKAFSDFSFLNAEIPLIGVSFNDLVDLAQRFETAVTEIVQNPAASIQLVEQKIRETFGLPAGDVFDLELVDKGDGGADLRDMLKVRLNLSKAFSEALDVDLDLSDQLPGISIMGSAGLNITGTLSAVLSFGVDLDDPTQLYLFTESSQTGINANLQAKADNLTFNAALGPLGIFITGGDVDFNLVAGFATSGGAVTDKMLLSSVLSDPLAAGFNPIFNGSLTATLPVFFPTQSNFKGDIEFEATLALTPSYEFDFDSDLEVPPDILNIDFSQFSLFDSMLLAVDTFDSFLAGIQDLLDGEIFGIKLPLIGDTLADGAEFINDMRKGVIQPLRGLVETAQTQGTTIVQTFLFDLLGPGNLDQGGSIKGLGLLLDPTDLDSAGNPTAATSSDRANIDAIVKRSENLTGPIATNFAQWNFMVGQVYTPPLDFDFDLGFPGLSLDLDGNLNFSLGWTLALGLGLSIKDGPYIEVTRSNSNDDPTSHTVGNVNNGGNQAVFENISPNTSDLDTQGTPNGSASGRINGLASVAGTNQVFYAASEYGGIYKTTDGGNTWVHLDGHMPTVTWDVEVDPATTTRVYATSFFDGRINSIAGINVSNDGGATWTHPASSVPITDGSPSDNTPQKGYLVDPLRVSQPSAYGISIQPGSPANVAIGTNAGVAISHDSGATWQFFNPYTASVFFDTNSFDLADKADNTTTLDAFVPIVQKYLTDNPTYNVEIAGYTDTVGTVASNQTLSENRANAVRTYLIGKGIDGSRLTTVWYGEQAAHLAVDTGDGDDGGAGTAEQANRRTEIHLQAVDIYDVIYQAGGIIDVAGALGHARSTDNGATWGLPHQTLPGQGGISIAASPDENYVLFMVSTSNRLYESDDAGANWTLLGSDTSPQGRIPFVTVNDRSGNGGRDFDIWFGDTNLFRIEARTPLAPAMGGATRAFPAGLPVFATDGISNNGNATVDESSEWWLTNAANLRAPTVSGAGAHADVGDVVFDSLVLVDALPKLHSSDGGVYRNTANSQVPNWEQPTVVPHALFIMGFVGVDQPGNDDEDLYFMLQDNGVWALQKAGAANPAQLTPANGGWHNAASADAFDITADDDRVLFNNGVFGSGRRERIFLGPRGLPGFETTPELGTYPTGAVIDFKHSEAYDTWGNDKFAILTADTNVFGDNTFGDGGLFITNNIKAGTIVWTPVNDAAEPNSALFADLQVALDGSANPTFYVTVGSGTSFSADQLWKVTGVLADGSGAATATWTRIDTNISGASGISIFAADPSDPNKLYAAALVGGAPRIYKSTNGGDSWDADLELDQRMVDPDNAGGDDFLYRNERGPADFPFNARAQRPNQGLTGYPQPTLLAFDPDSNIVVAGGADSGVFISTDGGENWELLTDPLGTNPNVPHIPRPRFAYFDHEGGVTTLYIASQGSGIWRIKLDVPTQTGIAPDAKEANDTKATAAALTGGEPSLTDMTIHNNTDVDYYEYTAEQTGNAIVNLYFNNLFGDLNLVIKNSSDVTITTGEQGNVADQIDLERVIFPVVQGEKYYIVVSGASGATGFYDLVVQKSVPELNLFIEAGIGTGSTLTGTLGFLQLDVTASDSNFDGINSDGINGDGKDPTNIRADFTIDIFNGDNPADNRLSLFELGSVDAVIGLTAEAEVNLDLELGLNEDLLPDTISAALPTVKAKFLLDWSVGGPISDFSLDGGLKLIEFRDIGLDLGSFLSDTVGPIVAKIQEITGPLQPIFDIVTARIPVLSDLAGRTITLLDIAAAFGEFDPSMIYAVADIISLVNSINTAGGQELFIEIGDFKIVDAAHPEQSLLGGDGGGFLLNPNLDFSNETLSGLGIPDFGDKLGEIGLGLGDLTDPGVLDGLLGGASNEPAATTTKSMFSGGFSSTPDDSGFAFPLFEDPSQIFGLFLGRNATLITYDLPPFMMDFKWEVSFPIYPPLYGVVTAGIGMKIDLAFGYDTEGIRQFAEGNFQNPLDLIAGFYVSDTNKPDGSFGVDVPELVFKGTIGVGAELNLGVASAGVNANIILTVNFDLFDPNHDGKVRINELVSTFLFEARNGNPLLAPLAVFDIYGDISFQLSAFIKFLFFKIDFDITPPIVLFEFKVPFDREPILATERGDGTVLLNIGPNAAARQNGDVRDIAEIIFIGDGGAGKIAVWSPAFGVGESAAQLYSIGAGKAVVGMGGEGDDVIDASALTSNPVAFEGGSGNDQLKGGSGKDELKGDIGDDKLFGNAGDDVLYGGEGNDELDGGANNDIIFGDTGRISTHATTGSIRSSIGLKDGDDTIIGGADNDIIFGGGGDDIIGGDVTAATLDAAGGEDFIFGDGASIAAPGGVAVFVKITNPDGTVTFGTNAPEFVPISLTDRSGGGKDKIRGQGGKDVIFGGWGDDDLDGGAQDDTIYGETGFDLISGGGDADTIMGGTEDDRIFGFRDESYPGAADGGDTIFGQTGNDFIRGNQGNDTIFGNAGADVIFGDYGDDTIYGDAEPDLIFGGPDHDTIEGGTGNDIVFGDDGFVVWVNFFDPDIDDATDTPDDHRAIGLIGGDADVFDGVWNPALTDAQLDALDADIRSDADLKTKTLDLIKTLVNSTDGNDRITGGEGDDIVLGGADELFNGVKGDTIFGDFDPAAPPAGPIPAGEDILMGDGGRIQFADRRRENVRTIPGTTADEVGNDTISGNGGMDLIFGGGAADTLYGRMPASFTNPALQEDSAISDDDVLIGDDGEIQYVTLGLPPAPEPFEPAPGEEVEKEEAKGSLAGARAVFVFIRTEQLDANALATGGIDHAYGNRGEDIIFGGVAGDFLKGDDGADGDDIIFGDNGQVDFGLDDDGITTKITQLYTTDTLETTGGPDTIEGQDGNDIILGGVNNDDGIGLPELDRLFGDRQSPIDASDGQDIILGDNGRIRFNGVGLTPDADLDTLDSIETYLDARGGSDEISGNRGDDVMFGGTGGDTMYGDDAGHTANANDGEDIMFGDNGDVVLIGTVGRLIVHGTAVDVIRTTDVVEATGGGDTMSGNAMADIMLGGVNNGAIDFMYGDRSSPTATTIANDRDDVLLGDNGVLDFTFGSDTDRNTLDLVRSSEDGRGGTDNISGDRGLDVAIGGTGGDTIYGDNANASAGANDQADLLLGDNADILLVVAGLAVGGDLRLVLGSAVKTIRTTDEEHPEYGGSDTISGNAKGDLIAGGVFGDTIYGDRASEEATQINDGNDIILGDNGAFEWLSNGRLAEITGIDIAVNNSALFAKFGTATFDSDLTTLDLVTTEQPNSGGRDKIFGDEGRDMVFGGTDSDEIYGDDGLVTPEGNGTAGNADLLFGDHGRLYPQFSTLRPNGQPWEQFFHSRNFFAIDIGNTQGGEGDRMWGEEGDDTMLGQQGDDRMWGGSGNDDMTGGHNVAGGYDELTLPVISAGVNPAIGVPAISGVNDLMDGGSGSDSMVGDNVIMWRRSDDLSPRFRVLTTGTPSVPGPIYTTTNDTIVTNIGADWQSDPADIITRDIQLIDHSDAVQANPLGRFGSDVMAGGADSDVMFGQLANDLMQGDGFIGANDANSATVTYRIDLVDSTNPVINPPDTDESLYFNIPEAATDADDYMEGNGGNDLMYGGLGQDDIIGGSSELFGLDDAQAALLGFIGEQLRPDGSDVIYGGAGSAARLARNDFIGSTDTDTGATEGVAKPTPDDPMINLIDRHARDADFIMGDNANVYRLVNPPTDAFLVFNYDNYGGLRIIPRAMQQLDYTLGGGDYNPGGYNSNGQATVTGRPVDNGLADLIYGESGDDIVFAMTGSDIVFGNSENDDIVGGYGNDWTSGGTGWDGILGDDGLVLTSRNSTIGEPLNGVAGLLAKDPEPRYAGGNVLDEVISTPGNIQYAIINKAGELKKTVDLVPFSFDNTWIAHDDEYPDNANNTPFADDIIFGGLDNDFLHGGSGDDAISGAEALEHAYVPTFDANGNPNGILDLGYNAVGFPATTNPGDVLAFNPIDVDGQHLNNRFRAGEFFLYDEYEPLRKVLLNSDGTLRKPGDPGAAFEFLLNFDQTEGLYRPGGTITKATGQQAQTYPAVNDDGTDRIFGDLGNDYLVGGTGADDIYGGWGNDLLNADDNQTTNSDANDQPDTHPYYEDRAFGGAGRDVLIGNTGGDRLIDWVGEYNSYLVPYAPYGEASVSRTLQPFLPEFLYALSRGDGADQTRPADTGADPLRNGEPDAEMGLILQKDFAWQDQTGAPSDPQAGNIPGGQRDVLRSAGFNDGTSDGFVPDSGTWSVANGRYQVSPTAKGGDAVSVFYVDNWIPSYFEMLATINAAKPMAGSNSNAYVVFDYQGENDFKFAGVNVSTNKLEIGHRNAQGWFVDKQGVYTTALKSATDYNVFLALNGTTATLVVNNRVSMSFTFAPRTDIYGMTHGLNAGMVGLGARNSTAAIDNVVVQRLAPVITLDKTVDFSNGTTNIFQPAITGSWNLANGRYEGSAEAGTPAVDLYSFEVAPASYLNLSATLSTTGAGGFVYDYYGTDDFKFVTISAATQQVILGHRTSHGWFIDAAVNYGGLSAGTDYTLGLTLKGTTASVTLNGQLVTSHTYNALVTDGAFGLFSRTGTTSFDSATVKTDDPALAGF